MTQPTKKDRDHGEKWLPTTLNNTDIDDDEEVVASKLSRDVTTTPA